MHHTDQQPTCAPIPTAHHTVWVNFTGTPAQVFRLWWPYADPNAEIIVLINYLYTPNRRFVWMDSVGRMSPAAAPPAVGDGSPHGTYYWNQNTTEFWVKLKGGKSLEIRTENAVQVG